MQAKNERTGQSCYVSPFEFMEHHSIFGDEVRLFTSPIFYTTPFLSCVVSIARSVSPTSPSNSHFSSFLRFRSSSFKRGRAFDGAQVAQLRAALDNGREYAVSSEHDPSLLLLQGTHQLGVATLFTEPIVYMMATEVRGRKEERGQS